MRARTNQISTGWTSSEPVWAWGALCVAVFVFAGMCWLQYAALWNSLEQYYMPVYAKTAVRAQFFASSSAKYSVIEVIDKHGQRLLAHSEEIMLYPQLGGNLNYRLSAEALEHGRVSAILAPGQYNDRALHRYLQQEIYADQSLADYLKLPACVALAVLLVLLFIVGPLDRKRSIALLRGQRLSGTQQLSVAALNRRMRRREEISGPLLDGVVFRDAARSWLARQLNSYVRRGVYVPREREQQHIILMGDTGSGKSAAIRQTLLQVQERGELAIVYDPAGEYIRQFYRPERGDVILNPLDARCLFYALADEIEDDADAATLAASLFPERAREQPFFTDAARRLFAHLLRLRPTPDELVDWLSHPSEIDKRVRGTELETLLATNAPGQRNGVLASLNMVADALKLLPKEDEVKERFSTLSWVKQRKGWIFISSTPETRIALRPLISLWIDLLVLRILRTGAASGAKTWFVLDELHSLQQLPQLAAALTETRKANCVMMLGFQGRAQIVDLYGPLAEALLSQAWTKLFFATSDPDAAKWIERAIGEVEYLRHRISQSQGHQGHNSESQQREIVPEPLVRYSTIMGLEPLECYIKHGQYAVHLHIQYMEPDQKHLAYVRRKRASLREKLEAHQEQQPVPASTSPAQPLAPESSTRQQHEFFE